MRKVIFILFMYCFCLKGQDVVRESVIDLIVSEINITGKVIQELSFGVKDKLEVIEFNKVEKKDVEIISFRLEGNFCLLSVVVKQEIINSLFFSMKDVKLDYLLYVDPNFDFIRKIDGFLYSEICVLEKSDFRTLKNLGYSSKRIIKNIKRGRYDKVSMLLNVSIFSLIKDEMKLKIYCKPIVSSFDFIFRDRI